MSEQVDANRLLRFALVGLTTAIIYYGVAWLLFVQLQAGTLLSSGVACITALIFNYRSHYHWTFAVEAPHGEVFVRYLVMVSLGVVLNGAVMFTGVDVLGGGFVLVQTVAGIAMLCWSLSLSSLWVFRD